MSGMTMTAFQGPGAQMDDTNAGLPTLARPVTGLVGIGGVPVQGQLFPPLRANTDLAPLSLGDVKTRIDLPKRTKSGPPKVGKGKLAISAPIPINDPEAQNAFSKIPTVDLATAAKNEQERREGYARRVSLLIANRPAPKPPLNTSVAGNLSTGLSRKEIVRDPSVEIERSDSMKYSQNGGLSVEGNASSTSAQLSPGSEELRRRSPRQPVPTNPPAKTPTFQPITPGQSFRIPIPRAQPPPEPASGRIPEPVKTPLLRRPTNGLPSNPRAQTTKKPAEQLGNSEPQTVMFINRISYDDPSYVNDIIQEATKTPFTPLRSSNSVVHRPRPIPRKGDRDRQVFPAEISTSYGHRRTKSGGSIIRTQSILQSQTGSPTPLPPLPPPQSAGNTLRPQPNDTKSMTFDEKMSMFYTGPPSASSVTSATRRRSSVPDLPPLPPTFLPAVVVPPVQQPAETDNEHRLARTTSIDQSSIRTHSILGVEDLGDKYLQSIGQSPAGELGNSWLPGLPSDYAPNPVEYEGNRRQSSPIIPAIRYSNLSSTSDAKTYDDDAAANWGSVHSPIAPFNLSASRLNAQSTYNNKDPRLGSILSGFGDEVMTVMLDTNSEFASNNRQSFLLDNEDSVPDVPKVEQRGSGQWHHLIGEDCPTFSTRKQKVKSRKMPPPAPLLLRAASNKNAMIIHTAEPSPVESPNAAYNMIQAQLRNLDEPSRDSVASGGRRLALLEDLELEMGQQESRWQTMQHNLDRDSISTIQTDSRPVSIVTPPRGVTRSSSTKSILAERRASRRSRMLKEAKSRDDLLAGAVSSIERLDNSRASLFQTRLAAAQLEFTENAADMIMKRNNLNFFSVSKADLGSPTPPDSDESDEEIFSRFESLNAKIAQSPPKEIHFLWQPAAPVITFSNQLLWKAPVNNSEIVNHVALPGLSVRPAARKSVESLPIESSDLWQKLSHPSKPRPGLGLWCKASPEHLPEPQAIQNVRPLTQRPPRRSKRVTLLPDIGK